MSSPVIAYSFNRTIYLIEDFEIKYDPRSELVSLIRTKKFKYEEYVRLSVNSFKILVTLIADQYHTLNVQIEQQDGYTHLTKYSTSDSNFGLDILFRIQTISKHNTNHLHLKRYIALEIYENSSKFDEEIQDMDNTYNNYRKLNPLYFPNLGSDDYECLGNRNVLEGDQRETWETELMGLLDKIKYSSLSNPSEQLVDFVINHQLHPLQIPSNVIWMIKDHHRYIKYLNSSIKANTLESDVKCSKYDEDLDEVNDSIANIFYRMYY